MNNSIHHAYGWLWLTVPIALLLALSAGGGVFASGLYRDNAYWVAQAVAQDFVSLFVVLPTLVIAAFAAGRGSRRGWLVWLGVLVYLVYTYAMGAFDTHFNALFLAYVALLGCALYALIGGLATANAAGVKASFGEHTPVQAVSIYLAVLAVLFYGLWLSEDIPALLAGTIPQSVQLNGTPTNSAHVLDMAWILPAFLITAAGLRRGWALAYTLAGALLTFMVLLTLAILSMVVFQIMAGQLVERPQVIIFASLVAASLGMLGWYLRDVRAPAVRRDMARPAWST